jgi:uncharacterized membrane protein
VFKQQAQNERGQYFGLIIAIFGISAGSATALLGQPTVGAVIAGATVVSIATAFIYGKQSQRKSLAQKDPDAK